MKTLTIYYSMTFYKQGDNYYCNGAFGRYLDELSKYIEKINVCVPVSKQTSLKNLDYKITSQNIYIQEMPDYRNVIGSIKKSIPSIVALKSFSKHWKETVYIRWPSPYSYIVFLICRFKKIKTVVHIVGDSKSVVENGNKYKGLFKYLAIMYAKFQDTLLRKIMKKSINISNGVGMRRIYSDINVPVNEIRTSTIMKQDIKEKKITLKEKNSVNLLYVGYLRQEKGLNYLLEALKLLERNTEKDIVLNIVGDGEEYESLNQLVKELGIEEKVNFKGYVPLGEALFQIYRENDIFVLPSLSEGTPRVLIEAMANGLAVIATDVGGIPYSITNNYNGILINKGNSNEIANSIEKVFTNLDFTYNIVANGYEFAQLNTLESHSKEIISIIESREFCV
ncbi:glycosyltransferase family 4 protein [Paraclostridium sordellii]|uniref:glycosyltransferase family 4 protein n=1 Tax=Paraclostridium sordellii TaxID=1505 RepID=UPI0022E0A376|nr:glycosyltransferase family 4 protein [Paeniclostridium sordellii]